VYIRATKTCCRSCIRNRYKGGTIGLCNFKAGRGCRTGNIRAALGTTKFHAANIVALLVWATEWVEKEEKNSRNWYRCVNDDVLTGSRDVCVCVAEPLRCGREYMGYIPVLGTAFTTANQRCQFLVFGRRDVLSLLLQHQINAGIALYVAGRRLRSDVVARQRCHFIGARFV